MANRFGWILVKDRFWELLNSTQQSTFSDIIKGRLYG